MSDRNKDRESRERDNQSELERRLASELRQLPLPRAPHTLLPRVMQAIDAASHRAWYGRAWLTWPWPLKIASVATAALLTYALWRLPHALPPAPPSVAAAIGTTRVIWALIQPLLPYLVAVIVLMAVACVVFGAALNYVLLERVEQRR